MYRTQSEGSMNRNNNDEEDVPSAPTTLYVSLGFRAGLPRYWRPCLKTDIILRDK